MIKMKSEQGVMLGKTCGKLEVHVRDPTVRRGTQLSGRQWKLMTKGCATPKHGEREVKRCMIDQEVWRVCRTNGR